MFFFRRFRGAPRWVGLVLTGAGLVLGGCASLGTEGLPESALGAGGSPAKTAQVVVLGAQRPASAIGTAGAVASPATASAGAPSTPAGPPTATSTPVPIAATPAPRVATAVPTVLPEAQSGEAREPQGVADRPQATTEIRAATVTETVTVPAIPRTAAPGNPAASAALETSAASEQPQAPARVWSSLWDRIRAGFGMPDLPTALVAEKERVYLTRPEYLQRMLERGARYLFHIVEEIEKRGMPTELALLPFVESAMNPTAMSPAKASGLWQFIPSTGRHFDLRQDWWVDNRRDVVQSTQAALEYLQRIYTMHGNDWFLALASYNWGEGAVARAVRRNQALGRPADYLSLAMPNETRHYVPKLIALKNLVLHAERLGLTLPDLPNRPFFVTLEKTRPIDLQLAARLAGMSVEDFVALNPAHNRPVISASRNNQLKLPADRVEHFKAALASHAADSKALATWAPLTLKPGDTLDAIAQRSGVSVAELRRVNGLRDGSRIIAGTQLLAPAQGEVDEAKIENFVAPRIYEQVDRPARYHTVDKRDTLSSIAGMYNIPAATLAAWNGIKSGVVKGMRLLVQPAGTQTLLTAENGERTVVRQTTPTPQAIQATAPAVALPSSAPPGRKLAADTARPAPRSLRSGGSRASASAAPTGRRPAVAASASGAARAAPKATPAQRATPTTSARPRKA